MHIVALVALAVSVLSIGMSYFTYRRTVKLTQYGSASDITLEIDRLFVEHPQVRPLFYENAPLGSTQDRDLALAIAEFMTDSFESLWDMVKSYEDEDRKAWSDYFRFMYSHSSVLRQVYDSCPESWYPAITAWLKTQHVKAAADLVP